MYALEGLGAVSHFAFVEPDEPAVSGPWNEYFMSSILHEESEEGNDNATDVIVFRWERTLFGKDTSMASQIVHIRRTKLMIVIVDVEELGEGRVVILEAEELQMVWVVVVVVGVMVMGKRAGHRLEATDAYGMTT